MEADNQAKDSNEGGAEIFDFVEAYFEDQAEGVANDLAHYLKRFPGREELITREFEALSSGLGLAAASETPPGAADSTRVGPYEIVEEIGRGGQGVVYLATDTRIERTVALKVLPQAVLFLSQDRRHRLRREAEVISRLAHPGICGIFDAEISEELAYIAMPFVRGTTLSAAIAAARDGNLAGEEVESSIPLAPKTEADLFRLLEFFEQAARALHSAHEVGVVHRDVKPGNLMVTPEGAPVWLDFGQARDAESSMMDLTMSGEVFGTPAYMSAEQVSGGAVGPRTDVWSLGVSLFEALTLTRPFDGASAHALMIAVHSDEPKVASELNSIVGVELSIVLETALERDLTRRYSSALAFAEDLANLRRHEMIRARTASRALRVRRWIQRHPVMFLGGTAMTIGLIVTTILLMLREEALEHALGRHLAERSGALLHEDPSAALVLGIEAVEHASNYLTRSALYDALEHCQLRAVYEANIDPLGKNAIMDIVVVPGGEHVVSARSDGTGSVHDLKSGRRLAIWSAHEPLESVAPIAPVLVCSLDGSLVAGRGDDGDVYLHNLKDGTADLTFAGPGGRISKLVFGENDETIAVGGTDGALILCRVDTGARIAELATEAQPIADLRFDRSSSLFVEIPSAAQPRGELRMWDASGSPFPSLFSDGDPVVWASTAASRLVWISARNELFYDQLGDESGNRQVSASIDGKFKHASLSGDGSRLIISYAVDDREHCSLIELETGEARQLEAPVDDRIVNSAFSPSSQLLAVIRSDSVLRVWDLAELRVVAECRGYLGPSFLQWSDDGESIVTGRYMGPRAQLWFATQTPDVYRMNGGDSPILEVSFAPDGGRALTRSESGVVRLWSTPLEADKPSEYGALLHELAPSGANWDHVSFSADGAQLLLSGGSGAELWDVNPILRNRVLAEGRAIASACFDSDGESILLVDREGFAESYAVREAADFTSLNNRDDNLAVYPAPEGSVRVTTHTDDVLRCWNSGQTANPLWAIEQRSSAGEQVQVIDLAFAPDGMTVAVARSDNLVQFLDVRDGGVASNPLKLFPIGSIDWASDAQHFLVTGRSGRGAVRVIDLEQEDFRDQNMRAETFHAKSISGGSFSPSGQFALTTSHDGTLMIRDVSGRIEPRATVLVAHIQGPGPAMLCADFSSGSDEEMRVIVGMADGMVGVWPVDPLPAAKARKPRDLADWEIFRERRFALPLKYR
ncbi:MAG: WD40 repeat protein/tRNA A-37 threonylcarbamoyl transferase component Bud32 [Planctomycetota bacterium]